MASRCVLAIETSTRRGSVALLLEEDRLAERFLEDGAVQGRELAPCLVELLRGENLVPSAVDLVAVGLGPGSYTGLRVGIALAHSFAYGLGCAVVGVSSLAALALREGGGGPVLCVAKAGRDEFYHALFDVKEGRPVVLNGPAIDGRREAAGFLPASKRVLGEGAGDLFGRSRAGAPDVLPTAAGVALLGRLVYRDEGQTPKERLLPLYLRRSKAQINWEMRRNN